MNALLMVLAIMLTTSGFVACRIVQSSVGHWLSGSLLLTDRADAEIVAPTNLGLDRSTVDAVERTRGVAAVAPTVRTKVDVMGRRTALFGIDARSRILGASLRRVARSQGVDFASDPGALLDGVFVGPGLADRLGVGKGGHVTVTARGRSQSARVLGVVESPELPVIDGGDYVVGLLPVAQDLSGRPDVVDAVDVQRDRRTSTAALVGRLTRTMGARASVIAPAERVAQARDSLWSLYLALVVLTALVTIAGALLVLDLCFVVVRARARTVDTLLRLGARRGLLVRGIVVERLLLAVVGAFAGLWVGQLIARDVAVRTPSLVEAQFRIAFVTIRPPDLTAWAFGLAAGLTVAGSLVALWPTIARPPASRASTTGQGPRDTRRVAMAVLLAVAVVVVAVVGGVGADNARASLSSATLAAGALLGAAMLALWWFRGRLATVLARVTASRRSLQMTALSLRAGPGRVWALTAASTLAVAVVIATTALATEATGAATSRFESYAAVDLVVQTAPLGHLPASQVLPGPLVQSLTRLPAVRRITADRFALADGTPRALFEALGTNSEEPILRRASAKARVAARQGGRVIVSRRFAADAHVGVGSTVRFSTPRGERASRVVAVVDVPEYNRGSVAFVGARNNPFADSGATRVEIDTRPGRLVEARAAVARLLRNAPVPVTIARGRALEATVDELPHEVEAGVVRLGWFAAAVVLLVVFDAFALSVLQRRRELGMLAVLGMRPRAIRRMVVAEALACALAAAVVGVPLGVALTRIAERLAGDIVGMHLRAALTLHALALSVLGVLALAIVGAVTAVWRAERASRSYTPLPR